MAKPVKKKTAARPKVKKSVSKPAPKPKAVKAQWATKDDLRLLAPKTALGRLAAREELAVLATKEEIAKMPSGRQMEDLEGRIEKLARMVETLDKKIEWLASQQGDHPTAVSRLQEEIVQIRDNMSLLEAKFSEKPAAENEFFSIENRLSDHETRLQNLEGLQ